jgi:hypothetical protein
MAVYFKFQITLRRRPSLYVGLQDFLWEGERHRDGRLRSPEEVMGRWTLTSV